MNKEIKENTKSPSKKIPYTKPTITRVKLDPKQAILATCIRYQEGVRGCLLASGACTTRGEECLIRRGIVPSG